MKWFVAFVVNRPRRWSSQTVWPSTNNNQAMGCTSYPFINLQRRQPYVLRWKLDTFTAEIKDDYDGNLPKLTRTLIQHPTFDLLTTPMGFVIHCSDQYLRQKITSLYTCSNCTLDRLSNWRILAFTPLTQKVAMPLQNIVNESHRAWVITSIKALWTSENVTTRWIEPSTASSKDCVKTRFVSRKRRLQTSIQTQRSCPDWF